MNPTFHIANREIGLSHQPLLIAEIGINHSGCLNAAKSMVDSAYRAGIEVVKHQTHIPSDEYSKEGSKTIPGHTEESILEIMEKCSLSESDEYELYKYTKSKNMIFISTPFSKAALQRIIEFDLPAIKIGSGECSNYPLLRKVAEFKKPVILSTGMNNISSVRKAIECLSMHGSEVAILHTTNIYPTPHDHVRLAAMMDLHNNFPKHVFGLSDHTVDSISSLGAIALGASIIERHFTDTKNRVGPDICCSMDEKDATKLVQDIKVMKKCVSHGAIKEAHPNEKATIDFAFASVVSLTDIEEGTIFSEENLWVKRPGTGGISAAKFQGLLGRKATSFIEADTQLRWDQVN